MVSFVRPTVWRSAAARKRRLLQRLVRRRVDALSWQSALPAITNDGD